MTRRQPRTTARAGRRSGPGHPWVQASIACSAAELGGWSFDRDPRHLIGPVVQLDDHDWLSTQDCFEDAGSLFANDIDVLLDSIPQAPLVVYKDPVRRAPRWMLREVFADFDGRCAYCLLDLDLAAPGWHERYASPDHIVAYELGGQTSPVNLAPACTSCQTRKWHRTRMKDGRLWAPGCRARWRGERLRVTQTCFLP